MGYPTQFSMSGELTKGDMEYHTSIIYDVINFNWSKIGFKYQDEPIFFHLLYRSLCPVNLRPEKLLTCLDPQYKIVTQCQNIVYVLHEHEIVQPKLRVWKELTDRTEYNINDSQSDIVEEFIHVQTDAIMLK